MFIVKKATRSCSIRCRSRRSRHGDLLVCGLWSSCTVVNCSVPLRPHFLRQKCLMCKSAAMYLSRQSYYSDYSNTWQFLDSRAARTAYSSAYSGFAGEAAIHLRRHTFLIAPISLRGNQQEGQPFTEPFRSLALDMDPGRVHAYLQAACAGLGFDIGEVWWTSDENGSSSLAAIGKRSCLGQSAWSLFRCLSRHFECFQKRLFP